MKDAKAQAELPPVAMISGASRGIGAAIARELANNGWSVSLGLRDVANGPLRQSDRVLICPFDALKPATETEWVTATTAKFGRIDGLVHNAGIYIEGTPIDATDEEFDRIFEVNVKSPMRLTREAWPHLAGNEANPGRIVTLASLSGKRIKSARAGLYGMSKFAAVGLAHALRQCGKENGVRSTAICPSFVATDMGIGIAPGKAEEMTRPEDVARIVRLVLELPPTASISEIPVHWTVEECY